MNILTILLYVFLFLIIATILWMRKPHWLVTVSVLFLYFSGGLFGLWRYTLPHFTFPEPTGPYAVGITTIENNQTVRALVWYPATPDDQSRHYAYLTHFYRPLMGLPPLIYSHLKGRTAVSYQDVPAVADRFPIVIYTHSADGFAEENSFLLTELASHGFVVISLVHAQAVSDYALDLQSLSTQPVAFLDAMRNVVMPDRLQELSAMMEQLPQLNQTHPFYKTDSI